MMITKITLKGISVYNQYYTEYGNGINVNSNEDILNDNKLMIGPMITMKIIMKIIIRDSDNCCNIECKRIFMVGDYT